MPQRKKIKTPSSPFTLSPRNRAALIINTALYLNNLIQLARQGLADIDTPAIDQAQPCNFHLFCGTAAQIAADRFRVPIHRVLDYLADHPLTAEEIHAVLSRPLNTILCFDPRSCDPAEFAFSSDAAAPRRSKNTVVH